MKVARSKKVIHFTQVLDLREVAVSLNGDLPHLSLLLELVICGLSKTSIANLTLDDIVDGKVHWQSRRNVKVVTTLSPGQLNVLDEYLAWRKTRQVKHNRLLLVKQSSKLKDGYYLPIKPERVRSDIRFLGRQVGLDYGLEIPAIHQAIVSEFVAQHGKPSKTIKKNYKLYD